MSRKPILTLGVAMLLGVALTAAGCGGGGGESKSAATTEVSATTEAATTPAATAATETTETDSTETPDLSEFATTENCREFANLAAKLSQAFSVTGASDVENAAKVFKEFADEAPEDIRGDFQVVAEVYGKITEALKGVDLSSGEPPSAEVIQRLQQLSTEIDDAELTTATSNIGTWVQKNCTQG